MSRPRSLVLALAVSCLARVALAADAAPPPPEAKKAFADGKSAYERGDYEQALADFQRAALIAPAPSLHYNIGMAYERLGRYEESATAFDKYLAQVEPPKTDADRTFQDNLRSRSAANHARGLRPSQTPPPAPLVEPPPPQPRPGYYAPYPYYGYGYPYAPPPPPVLSRSERIKVATRHRNNGIIFSAIGMAFIGVGIGVTAYATTIPGEDVYGNSNLGEQIGVYWAGISGLVIGIPLLIPGARAWAIWQKKLNEELRSPDDGAATRKASLELVAPPVQLGGTPDQIVLATPVIRF